MTTQPPLPACLAESVLLQMAEAVIYSNRQGIIEIWNPAAAAMFGHSADQALGQSLDLIIPERLRAAHWRGFEAAMQSGRTRLKGQATTTRALHRSGETRYVDMSFALVCDEHGQAIGSVAVARDATERILQAKAANSDRRPEA